MITKRNLSIVIVVAALLSVGAVVMMITSGGQTQPPVVVVVVSIPTVTATPTPAPSPTPTAIPEPLEPVQLVFVERRDPGEFSYGRIDNPIPYLFSLEGFPLESLSVDEIKRRAQVPFGVDRTREKPYLLVVYVPSQMSTTTYGISLRLPDGRNPTVSFEHERIELVSEVTPTSTPMPTPTVAPTLTPTPTPKPTVVATPESRSCLPWPEEMARILVVLSVPDELCLMEVSGRLPGVSYLYGSRTVGYWYPDWLPPPMPSEKIVVRQIVEQICVAHQHQVVMDSDMEFNYQDAWSKTPEGAAYMKTTGWSFQDGVWYQDGVVQEYVRPSTSARQACASWYLGYPMYPKDRGWAERWLPLPPPQK